MNFTLWQWLVAATAALLVGIAKTGITGLSLLFVGMFASVMPAKRSTGVVLPLLIIGDIVAFVSYRRHTQWRHVWGLVPWAAVGVVIGYFAMGRMDERQTRICIGLIVISLTALHIYRRVRPSSEEENYPRWFAPLFGILAGFTTLVSNASGPLLVIYLLAMRLPKMEYMGTGAAFFFVMNIFKTPFMIALGLVTPSSLLLDLQLAPAVILGAIFGRVILKHINQQVFETIALLLTFVAGLRMFV